MNVPVYVVDPRKWLIRSPATYGFTLSPDNGPSAFLNLMRYAKRCYVESFHGMVFAYVFRKNFWLLDTHRSLDEMDTRLLEFVKLLGIEHRVLTPYNAHKMNQSQKLDYTENTRLRQMQKSSLAFLHTALGD